MQKQFFSKLYCISYVTTRLDYRQVQRACIFAVRTFDNWEDLYQNLNLGKFALHKIFEGTLCFTFYRCYLVFFGGGYIYPSTARKRLRGYNKFA